MSCNHSDESETDSHSSGGGAYGSRPAGHEPEHTDYNYIVDDRPFFPRSEHTYNSTRAVPLPPDPDSAESSQNSSSSEGAANREATEGRWKPSSDNVSYGGRSFLSAVLGPERESLPDASAASHGLMLLSSGQPRSGPSSPSAQASGSRHRRSSTNVSTESQFKASEKSQYPDAGEYLREQLNIAVGEPIDLWTLPDPPRGQRPSYPLPILVKLAIYGSRRKKLTLREIYEALEDRFEWFKTNSNGPSWKGSVRHSLSLNKVFRRSHRPINEPGQGSYWELDISGGEGYKRDRKRKRKTVSAAANEHKSTGGDDGERVSPPANSAAGEGHGSNATVGQRSRRPGTRRLKSTARGSPYPQPIQKTTASSSQPDIQLLSPLGSNLGQLSFSAAPHRQHTFGQPSLGPAPGYTNVQRLVSWAPAALAPQVPSEPSGSRTPSGLHQSASTRATEGRFRGTAFQQASDSVVDGVEGSASDDLPSQDDPDPHKYSVVGRSGGAAPSSEFSDKGKRRA